MSVAPANALGTEATYASQGTEVGNVGLLSLVHHVVMLVHMENVRWRDVVCPPALPPSRKGVIVPFHNHGHRTGSPAEQTFQTRGWGGYLVEVVESMSRMEYIVSHLLPNERENLLE